MSGHIPPQGARREAELGLKWRKEFRRGGTKVGVARARDLQNGRSLSDSTIQRMVSYFARHEVDKRGRGWNRGEPGFPSAGRIAWALWGGDAGRTWATRIHKSIMRGNPPPEDDESLEDFLDRASGEIHPEMRPAMPPIQFSGGDNIENQCLPTEDWYREAYEFSRELANCLFSFSSGIRHCSFSFWNEFDRVFGRIYKLSDGTFQIAYRTENNAVLLIREPNVQRAINAVMMFSGEQYRGIDIMRDNPMREVDFIAFEIGAKKTDVNVGYKSTAYVTAEDTVIWISPFAGDESLMAAEIGKTGGVIAGFNGNHRALADWMRWRADDMQRVRALNSVQALGEDDISGPSVPGWVVNRISRVGIVDYVSDRLPEDGPRFPMEIFDISIMRGVGADNRDRADILEIGLSSVSIFFSDRSRNTREPTPARYGVENVYLFSGIDDATDYELVKWFRNYVPGVRELGHIFNRAANQDLSMREITPGFTKVPDEVILRMRQLGRPHISRRLNAGHDFLVLSFGDWDLFVNHSGGTPPYMLRRDIKNEPYRFSNADELLDFARENFPEPVDAMYPGRSTEKHSDKIEPKKIEVESVIRDEDREESSGILNLINFSLPLWGVFFEVNKLTGKGDLSEDELSSLDGEGRYILRESESDRKRAISLSESGDPLGSYRLLATASVEESVSKAIEALCGYMRSGGDISEVKEIVETEMRKVRSLKDMVGATNEDAPPATAALPAATGPIARPTGSEYELGLEEEEQAGLRYRARISSSPFDKSMELAKSLAVGDRVMFNADQAGAESVFRRNARGRVISKSTQSPKDCRIVILLDKEFHGDEPHKSFVVFSCEEKNTRGTANVISFELLSYYVRKMDSSEIRASLLEINPANLVENPPWVTAVLAKDFEWLEDNVPAELLPHLKVSRVRGKRLKRMSAEMPEYGCGSYGCVVPTMNDKFVLKVTSDDSEADFATEMLDHLSAKITCDYIGVVTTDHTDKDGASIFYLWREAADHVGKIAEYLNDRGEDGDAAETAMAEQWDVAQLALDKLWNGQNAIFELEEWAKKVKEMGRRAPALRELSDGILKILMEDRIFFGDIKPDNVGLVNGKWVVIDPGNLVKLTGDMTIKAP